MKKTQYIQPGTIVIQIQTVGIIALSNMSSNIVNEDVIITMDPPTMNPGDGIDASRLIDDWVP